MRVPNPYFTEQLLVTIALVIVAARWRGVPPHPLTTSLAMYFALLTIFAMGIGDLHAFCLAVRTSEALVVCLLVDLRLHACAAPPVTPAVARVAAAPPRAEAARPS